MWVLFLPVGLVRGQLTAAVAQRGESTCGSRGKTGHQAKVVPAGSLGPETFPGRYYTEIDGEIGGEVLEIAFLKIPAAMRLCAKMEPTCRGFTFEGKKFKPGERSLEFQIHFKGEYKNEGKGNATWTSYRREELPPEKCPLVALDHLWKAGGNAAISYLVKAGVFSNISDGELAAVTTSRDGQLISFREPDMAMDSRELSRFRIGMVRSPCDYLLSVWSYQRIPGEAKPRCVHSGTMCTCLQRRAPAGQAFHAYLPVFNGSTKAMVGLAQRFAEGELTPQQINDDRSRFSKWLRLMAGRTVHLLSSRFHNLIRHPDKGPGADCPPELTSFQEDEIHQAIAREASDHSKFSCIMHTETMQADLETCLLAWARSCDADVSIALIAFFEKQFRNETWRTALNPRNVNAGSHELCNDFISEEDQAFIWERERLLAEYSGYKKCCF